LICKIDQLAYPIKDDIPVMLPNEATPLSELSITEPYQGDP